MARSIASFSLLALASLWQAVQAVNTPTPQALVPVPLRNVGNGHQGTEPQLRTAESWYWGVDGARAHANFTGYYGGEYQKVISMDRFINLLKSYECSENKDQIIFTFKDSSTYQSTKNEWDWVNKMTFRSFILTVQISGCQVSHDGGPSGDGRQPYQINGVTWDDSQHVAKLRASPKTWDEAVSADDDTTGNTWDMFVDSLGLASPGNVEKRLTIDKTASIQLAHDFSGNIFSGQFSGVDVSLDCSECHTDGSLDFQIHIIPFLIPLHLEGFAQVTPNGVGATAVVTLKASAQLTNAIDKGINLATVPLPGGFSIAGIANFGPTLQIGINTQLGAITAQAETKFGVRLDVPQNSIAKVDLKNSKNNQLSGWIPTFTPIPPTFSSSFSVAASVGPQVIVALEATVFGFGLAAGLALLAPKLEASLSAVADSAGNVCNNPNADLGVNFGLGIGAELDAFAGVGRPENLPGKFPILTTSANVFSTCFALETTAPPTPVPDVIANSVSFVPATPTAVATA